MNIASDIAATGVAAGMGMASTNMVFGSRVEGLATSLHFTPIVNLPLLVMLFAVGMALFVISVLHYKRALLWRMLVLSLFMLVLLNPSLLKEERNYTKDVVAIVIDQSASQEFGKRAERSQDALTYIQDTLKNNDNFEVRVIQAPLDKALSSRTNLFSALDQALSDIPARRRAGVIIISDGQIHDVPKISEHYEHYKNKSAYGPVHLLLSGRENDKDRRIVVTSASAYGLVGKSISVTYKIEDTDNINQDKARVSLQYHDGKQRSFYVRVNEEQTLELPIVSVGQNFFTLSVDGVADEITMVNNKTALLVNGVRDRLKVLLISGIPHSGERTWRDLLTSDPGVDLVHFTILREPDKMDYTPRKELSLIAFPFNELFNVKLYDFDLIIFDQYRVNNILPDIYFQNIVRYVRMGGAFLSSNGSAFATGNSSIYDTPLGGILPASPTGKILENRYKPTVTKLGHLHPVTRNLVWNNRVSVLGKKEPWGDWLRYIDIKANRGDVLMSAGNVSGEEKPLLVLDRVDKGRVAQLSSDHIWLWSRGFDGGGPHAELLRRIVHWLMKEPDLDERAFAVRVNKNQITIEKQSFGESEETLSMQTPDGETKLVTLKKNARDMLVHNIQAEKLGIYSFQDALGMRKSVIIGDTDPLEFDGVITTPKLLEPLIKSTGGTYIWLDKTPHPDIRTFKNAQSYGGSDWLALQQNGDFTVTRVRDIALFPKWISLLLLFSALLFLWWKEGKS